MKILLKTVKSLFLLLSVFLFSTGIFASVFVSGSLNSGTAIGVSSKIKTVTIGKIRQVFRTTAIVPVLQKAAIKAASPAGPDPQKFPDIEQVQER